MARRGSKQSLFGKNKNTPEFLKEQAQIRTSLIKSLSRAIKEVQLQFAQQDPLDKNSGSIGDCRGSQHVCSAFEEVLKHGLKSRWLGQGVPTFWPVVVKISRKQAIEYIGRLQHAKSESAKCRGWIRMAVNECSLESYINVICHDKTLLSQHYEAHSFLHDPESVSAMTQLLTGLSQITFKLTVDVLSLEFDSVPEAFSDVPLRMHPAPGSPQRHKKGPRKKGKMKDTTKPAEVDGLSSASSCTSLNSIPINHNSIPDPEQDCNGTSLGPSTDGSAELSDVQSHLLGDEVLKCEEGWEESQDGGVSMGEESSRDGGVSMGEESSQDGGVSMGEESSQDGGVSMDGGAADVSEEWEEPAEDEEGVDVESTLTMGLVTAEGAGHVTLEDDVTGHGERYEIGDLTRDDMEVRPEQQDRTDIGYHDLQDGVNMDDLQDGLNMDGDVQLERKDTLIAEDQGINPFATPPMDPTSPAATPPMERMSPATPLTFAMPPMDPISPTMPLSVPLSPLNPFISTTPPLHEDMGTANLNPFITASSNPFQPSPDSTSVLPSNPFLSHTPPTNPFDDHAHTLMEPHPPADCPAPHSTRVYDSVDSDLSSSHTPSNPPGKSCPDISFPPATVHPDADTMRPCPDATRPDTVRPDTSSSTSASPDPSRSHTYTTEDFDSSGSSVDMHVGSPLANPDEDFFAPEMSLVDVKLAIDRLKVSLAMSVLEEGVEKDEMRQKLVSLQMRLRQLQDEEEEEEGQLTSSVGKEIFGHKLFSQPRHLAVIKKRLCEGCGKRIRGLMSLWYLCKLCGFGYHKKCLHLVDRVCSGRHAHLRKDETSTFTLEVCPEKGLTQQQFRCARCNTAFNATAIGTRLCDYSGLYYCPSCHHNDLTIIPARVVHNWDFTPRKVCCKCHDLLERHSTKPLLKVRSINPQLYTHVQDLVTIETLRKDLMVMKKYFLECPKAKESRLLMRLDHFPHFKEGHKRFSMQDLKAVQSGELLQEIHSIHGGFVAHIKKECSVCAGKGFTCQLCKSGDVLYPFDRNCRQCPKCRTTFHKNCYAEMTTCPKCSRTRSHKKQS